MQNVPGLVWKLKILFMYRGETGMIRYHPGMTRGALVRTHKSEHIGGNKPTPTEKGAAIMHDLQSPSTPKLPFTYLTAHSSQAVPWASRAGPRASNTCFPQNVIQTLKQPQRPKCSYTPKLPSTWLPIATTTAVFGLLVFSQCHKSSRARMSL